MMLKKFRHSRSGFTLIELLIGMTIFSIALTSIYLLLNSTMKSVSYSRNEIIVSNLLREQIELVRNIRDSNQMSGNGWDVARIFENNALLERLEEGVFVVDNDFSSTDIKFQWPNGEISHSPVLMNKIDIEKNRVKELWDNAVLKEKFIKTQLCFDDQTRYVHCKDEAHKINSWTMFASYLNIFPMYYKESYGSEKIIREDVADDTSKPQWYIIDARVIVRDGTNYREYDTKTAITNWQQ